MGGPIIQYPAIRYNVEELEFRTSAGTRKAKVFWIKGNFKTFGEKEGEGIPGKRNSGRQGPESGWNSVQDE